MMEIEFLVHTESSSKSESSMVKEHSETSSKRDTNKEEEQVDLAGDLSDVDVRQCFTGCTARTIEEVEVVYRLHANSIGFCYRKATSRKSNDVIYERYLTCSCHGKPDTTTPPTPLQITDGTKGSRPRKRKVFHVTKTECKAEIRIKMVNGYATVMHHTVLHNHPLNRPEWQ